MFCYPTVIEGVGVPAHKNRSTALGHYTGPDRVGTDTYGEKMRQSPDPGTICSNDDDDVENDQDGTKADWPSVDDDDDEDPDDPRGAESVADLVVALIDS